MGRVVNRAEVLRCSNADNGEVQSYALVSSAIENDILADKFLNCVTVLVLL
jgi:hypothetical protein